MKSKLFAFFFLLAVTAGCVGGSRTYKRMVMADSLIMNEKEDAAMEILGAISNGDLKTEDERAYYNLLVTCARFRLYLPISSDSVLDESITYYKQTGNKEKLARALYYKGVIFFEFGKTEDALRCLKEAENMAKSMGNPTILNYIYMNLGTINSAIGNYVTAISYAKKSFTEAEKRGDKGVMCLSLDRIGTCFNFMNQNDSAFYYTLKNIPYVEYLKEEEKPDVLVDIAASYFNQKDFAKAEHYVRQSMAVEPTAHAYYILGSIYIMRGEAAKAWTLWNEALRTGTPELRAETMSWMADMKKEVGEYKEAAELMAKADSLNDSIRAAKEAENLLKMQDVMERDASERGIWSVFSAVVCVAVGIALVLAVLALWQRNRLGKAKRAIADGDSKMAELQGKIGELSASEKADKKEIGKLERKIGVLREKRAAILGRGRERYDGIVGGGTVAGWNKDDFEAIIEYCRTVMPDTVNSIEQSYRRITAYNVFFLLLPSLGVSDGDISRVMCVSAGAVRTMKYRLKGKLTAAR